MYGSLDMELDGQNVLSFPPLPPTAPFPNNPKYQSFAKIKKKAPADIIILYMCTINNNHMMYGSWDMECDRHNLLSFFVMCTKNCYHMM